MADRKTYLYRLDVVYPSDALHANGNLNWEWKPAGWDDDPANQWEGTEPDTGAPDWGVRDFRWPQRRNFLSRSGAENTAKWYRKFGATVTIVRSNPVTWPEVDHA